MASDQDLLFKKLLLSISDQLTTEDLDKMKFGLDFPQGTLEDVQKPFELFRRMMNAKMLCAENRSVLASLLQFAGRFDLSDMLLQHNVSQFKPTEGEFIGVYRWRFSVLDAWVRESHIIANSEDGIKLSFILH